MKFSVLLPTRNRLELLKYAVETVRKQDYDDWEVIISDNCSEEDVSGYVQSMNDPRIQYYRTAAFIPVTDNWNNALEKSTGDYVIMLGDDDCLMKGYFSTMKRVIEKYRFPDFIYTKAYLFAYPGVIPGYPDGYLQLHGSADFLKISNPSGEPFWLDREHALRLVQKTLDFRLSFDFNMQFSVISKPFITSLAERAPFFQSPYPDFYAHSVMFLKANRILIYPLPLVTIGISPKSFGFFYFNKREKTGIELLNHISLRDIKEVSWLNRIVLPGTDMNTSWLFSIETIKANYGTACHLQVNYQRYRFVQVLDIYRGYYLEHYYGKKELHELWKALRCWEKVVYGTGLRFVFMTLGLIPIRKLMRLGKLLIRMVGQYPLVEAKKSIGRYRNIIDVFEHVQPLKDPNKY